MSLDLAPAYGISGLERLERRFRFDSASGTLTLQDYFVFSSGLPVIERFVTAAEPLIEAGGFSLVVNGAQCSLSCSERIKPVVNAVDYRDHKGEDVRVFTVDFPFASEGTFSVEFIIR